MAVKLSNRLSSLVLSAWSQADKTQRLGRTIDIRGLRWQLAVARLVVEPSQLGNCVTRRLSEFQVHGCRAAPSRVDGPRS